MKLVCNKQITAVCDIYNTGNGFLVQLDGESLESIAGKMSGLNKSHSRKFPARVTLIIQDISDEMWLPVMDGANKAMKAEEYTYLVKNPNFRYAKKCDDGVYRDSYGREQPQYIEKHVDPASMFDVNKAIMRCLVKNLAMFGLGLYIYAGEDLPESEQPEPAQPVTPDSPDVEIAVAKGMCQTAMKAYAQRSGKGNKEVNDAVREYIGKNYKDFTVDDWRSAAQAVEGWT